jgi:hypothetical protein
LFLHSFGSLWFDCSGFPALAAVGILVVVVGNLDYTLERVKSALTSTIIVLE